MSVPPVFLKQVSAAEVLLQLHVQPGGKKTEILGLHGDALKVRVHAPPVDGKANDELIRFIAEKLQISSRDVCVLRGETSRQKTLRVSFAVRDSALPIHEIQTRLLTD